MSVPETDAPLHRLIAAALVGGLVPTTAFVALALGPELLDGTAEPSAEILLGLLGASVENVAWYGPFVLGVVLAVGSGFDRRTVAFGAAILFAVTLVQALLAGLSGPFEVTLVALSHPAAEVVRLLGVVLAVWLACHDGYERLGGRVGSASAPG